MKYNIGDKVKIVSERVFGMNTHGYMDEYLDTVMTIADVRWNTYRMLEDDGRWCWGDCMIEYKVEDEVTTKKGDDVVVSDGTAVLAIYNENERAIYPIHISNYAKMGFKNHFSRVLSDGTIIRGVHEDNTPHVKYVKCPDGQTFEGGGELGVIIKGGETMSSLFANKSLTKDDIELYNGTLYDANGEEIDSFGSGIGYYGEFPFFN